MTLDTDHLMTEQRVGKEGLRGPGVGMQETIGGLRGRGEGLKGQALKSVPWMES